LVTLLVLAALVSGHASAPVAQAAGVQTTRPMPGFAASLQMITDLLDRGRGIEAENVARALLARVESTMGGDVLEVADVLDLLGRAIRRSSKVTNEEKTALAERAVAIREKVLAPEHPQLATSLINLGVQRALAGDPAAARPLLERALAIREAALGPDHPLVAAALQSLGGLLMTLHDDAGAMVLLDRAQQIRETAYEPGHADTVRTLVNLAIFHQEVGDYTGARQRYARALAMGEKMVGPADLSTLNVLTGAAVVLRELGGDPAGSAILNERLLALTERSFGATDPRLQVPLENLAIDRRELGDYAAAKALAERSLAIAERAYGPNHVAVARNLHTLATVLAAQGAYAEALRLFERATRINEEVVRPGNPDVSRAAWFIPDLLPVSGYGSEDLILFEQAVAIRERTRGLANPGTAESLANLAALLSSSADFRRTQPLFERALASQEKFLGQDHPEVAAAATNLAYVLVQTGNGSAAAPLYERALGIWEKALGSDHPRVATALVNLAGAYSNRGNHDDAKQLVVRALAIQRKQLGPEHPETAHTLTKLAELAVRTGSTAEAFEAAADSDGIWREHVRLTARTLSERQALAYATSASTALEVMLSIAAARPADREASALMWDALIQSRGIVFDEMAARHRTATTTGNPEVAALSTTLASARQRLAALFIRGVRNDPPERYRRLLDRARDEKDSAERALAEKSDRFRDDQAKAHTGVADLAVSLPRDAALVAFARYRDSGDSPAVGGELSYLAFVLTGADRAPTLLPLGTAAVIEPLITQWQRQINGEAFAAGRAGARGEAAYRRVAEELRSRVWDPLVPHLSTATRVFIVPDGALHLVSFAALPTAPSRYLVETGPVIHYLSTERDLIVEGDRGSHANGLLAIGNPAFDESDVPPRAQPVFRGSRSACLDFQSMQFSQLPASATEVNAVVTLWNRTKRKTVRLIGTAATEGAFKAQAAGHGVLHLATHGFFLGGRCVPPSDATTELGSARMARENPLLLSGLILAGANRRQATPPDEEDGVLTAEEVAAMNLTGVEWAVLSGCDTGVGEIRAGEGVFGLRRAFQLAGAKTVIMSLWPVEDQATRQWMSALYENRFTKNFSSADAVRQASLSVLQFRRTKGVSTHPFYWAAFVAAGDWR
jgi:CHAT domain-containing protein/tetratricopeptide (TPR) repeat protein